MVRPDLYDLLTVHCSNMMKTVIIIYINSVINAALTEKPEVFYTSLVCIASCREFCPSEKACEDTPHTIRCNVKEKITQLNVFPI